MLENEIISHNKSHIFKYRYILISILAIIIVLLIIIMAVIFKNTSRRNNIVIDDNNNNNNEQEQAMLVELDRKRKEEEERQKEKQEEENATGIIYLTFDDGPSLDITSQILDVLSNKKIKATFFVVHFSEKNAELVKREDEEGHTVALHGYTHNYSEVYQSADACMENIKKIQQQVYETIGKRPNIIRFPGGSSNTISKKYCEGVMTEVTQRALNEGFKYFDWNVDSDDAGRAKTRNDVYNNVTSKIKPHRENVVLMHDFSRNNKTLEALSDIIDFGLQNGYVFRKITDETPMIKHSVNN